MLACLCLASLKIAHGKRRKSWYYAEAIRKIKARKNCFFIYASVMPAIVAHWHHGALHFLFDARHFKFMRSIYLTCCANRKNPYVFHRTHVYNGCHNLFVLILGAFSRFLLCFSA